MRVVTFDTLYASLDIAEVAASAKRPVEPVAAVYFDLGDKLGLSWLREKIAALPGDKHWQMLAKSAMQDDLSGLQRALTGNGGRRCRRRRRRRSWLPPGRTRNRRALERTAQLLAELRAVPAPDAEMLSVAMRELRNLG